MLEFFAGLIITAIDRAGYVGIFLLMTAQTALIPIPSEIILPFSGFLVAKGKFVFFAVVAVSTLGSVLGSLLSYWLGWWGQEAFIRKSIRRFGKYVLLTEEEYDKAKLWLNKYGNIIAFVSRLIPGVRTFISLPLGIAKVDLKQFTFYTFAGSLLWSLVLTYIGLVLGENWQSLEGYFRKFELAIVIVGVAFIAFYVNHKLKIVKIFK